MATPAEGEVGALTIVTTEYSTNDQTNPLEVDPGKSEKNSVLLPSGEPRSYAEHSGLATVTYEGPAQCPASDSNSRN